MLVYYKPCSTNLTIHSIKMDDLFISYTMYWLDEDRCLINQHDTSLEILSTQYTYYSFKH